ETFGRRAAGAPFGVRERATDQRLEAVADPHSRARLARRLEADGFQAAAQTVRDVWSRIDECAVEIDREQVEREICAAQNTRAAISAGAASKSSSSLASLSNVRDAPAISSDVQ